MPLGVVEKCSWLTLTYAWETTQCVALPASTLHETSRSYPIDTPRYDQYMHPHLSCLKSLAEHPHSWCRSRHYTSECNVAIQRLCFILHTTGTGCGGSQTQLHQQGIHAHLWVVTVLPQPLKHCSDVGRLV